ncbi:VOC family protein [Myxococcota bacterium]|nr:VOC family protein [Myxococcota bacterium]
MTQDAAPTQLGYLGMGVSDITAWEKFGTEVLGLESRGRDDDGSLLLRMDDYHHRFIFTEDSALDDLNLLGWEVKDEATLNALAGHLQKEGIEVHEGDEDAKNRRRVVHLIEFTDPNGIPTELYCGPLLSRDRPFQSLRPIGNFVAGEQGFGHLTMSVNSLEESLHFYRDVLGLRLSDWVRPQPDRGVQSDLNLAFLHCNRRHHSLAFWEVEMPKRMHHFMIQVQRLDDVGSTYDLCHDRDISIDLTLGRHTNDGMLSFYMKTPSGFDVEYGWGALEVDEEKWTVQLHTTGSSWGHRHL